jgi:hypothetical protein
VQVHAIQEKDLHGVELASQPSAKRLLLKFESSTNINHNVKNLPYMRVPLTLIVRQSSPYLRHKSLSVENNGELGFLSEVFDNS